MRNARVATSISRAALDTIAVQNNDRGVGQDALQFDVR